MTSTIGTDLINRAGVARTEGSDEGAAVSAVEAQRIVGAVLTGGTRPSDVTAALDELSLLAPDQRGGLTDADLSRLRRSLVGAGPTDATHTAMLPAGGPLRGLYADGHRTIGASEAGRNFATLVDSPDFLSLPEDARSRVLASAAAICEGPDAARRLDGLGRIIHSETFREMSAADQARVLTIFEATDGNGAAALARCLDFDFNGASVLFQRAGGASGASVLDSLERIARGPLAEGPRTDTPPLPVDEYLSNIMSEIANPGVIDQSCARTCAPTSVEYLVARNRPGDYARILADLACTGEARTPDGHGTMPYVPGSTTGRGHADHRGYSECVFQSSLMMLANPNNAYDPVADSRVAGIAPTGFMGDETAEVMSHFFGREMTTDTGTSVLSFADVNGASLYETARTLTGPAVVNMSWMGSGEHSTHALAFERMDGDSVILRNPWPMGTLHAGDPIPGMPFTVTVVDPNQHTVRISRADFEAHVRSIVH